jgi:uncharacterized protein YkuJ
MGGNNSKIDYYNIKDIMGPNFVNNKLNEYIITYNDGNIMRMKFTKDKERQFKNQYNYSLILKPIVLIKYSKINNITNFRIFKDIEKNQIENDDIYSFDIIYLDNTSQTIRLNKYQEDTFWKIFKLINIKKYNVCKNILKIVNNK